MATSFFNKLSTLFRKRQARTPEEFKVLFDRFKGVLESNNRSLEAITDMGEKLGGDYLFDIVYVRKAYEELRQEVETSLRNFGEMTRNSYPGLLPVFEHIDSLIYGALSESSSGAGANVLQLGEVPWGSVQVVGGKMAQVAELRNQLGLLVPDGFVVTTAGFSEFSRYNELEGLMRQVRHGAGDGAVARELRERILGGAIPPELSKTLRKALNRIFPGHRSLLSVRSSAAEEDGERSFAGQFRSLLGIPADAGQVEKAYREVIASLFDDKALAYQEQLGYSPGAMKMAVGCMVMVEAETSGVMYSSSPDGDPGTLLISAAWGLGESVVEGRTDSDLYTVRKGPVPELVQARVGRKRSAIRVHARGGTAEAPVPAAKGNDACLSLEQLKMLSLLAMKIERYFGGPRDIEWAIDNKGRPWILQARPLLTADRQHRPLASVTGQEHEDHPVIIRNQGAAVQPGAACGKIFIVKRASDIQNIPKGAVLVAPHDSSLLVRVMPFLAGIITETGSQTSHMAALCRELRVPAVVNVPGVTGSLRQGQEVTLVVGDNEWVLYQGLVPELLASVDKEQPRMEELHEFRRKRYILRYLSPLHLIDPLMDEFSPERCRTMHDILRFMHEKAVAELVESGRDGNPGKGGAVVALDLSVPAGIRVMDMGGGLAVGEHPGNTTVGHVTSVPFKAILAGMLRPGAWHSDAVALGAGDLLSSMMRMPDITTASTSTAGFNIAVISAEYVNMSIRFGYHFNMIDCFCSEKAKNNHIYFRFAGGATDLTKRSRRLDLISRILTEYGFGVKIKGDLLIARLAGLGREEMEQVLERTGALIAYARQLDAVLRDEQDVDDLAREFLSGNYELTRMH